MFSFQHTFVLGRVGWRRKHVTFTQGCSSCCRQLVFSSVRGTGNTSGYRGGWGPSVPAGVRGVQLSLTRGVSCWRRQGRSGGLEPPLPLRVLKVSPGRELCLAAMCRTAKACRSQKRRCCFLKTFVPAC